MPLPVHVQTSVACGRHQVEALQQQADVGI